MSKEMDSNATQSLYSHPENRDMLHHVPSNFANWWLCILPEHLPRLQKVDQMEMLAILEM
jgi:hypothetical protein